MTDMTSLKTKRRNTTLPLIRLSLLIPFTRELDQRDIRIDPILDGFDLSLVTLESPDVFAPAQTVYHLLEAMADAADDPYLAVYIGETLDLFSWPVFTDAARQALTFGDFFYRFSAEAGNQASSVRMCLDTDGRHATFRAQRVFEPDMVPAQADAFYVGLFRSIFQRCAGSLWDPGEVRISTCDPAAIPANYHGLAITRGDLRGCTIRFPQAWLSLPFLYEDFKQRTQLDIRYQSPPRSLLESLRHALQPHIHLPDLDAQQAAELCGQDKRALARKLKARGTTLMQEITRLREETAIRALLDTDSSIADIATSVGYSDPSVFSRAFRKWTGMSPREYRKRHTVQ